MDYLATPEGDVFAKESCTALYATGEDDLRAWEIPDSNLYLYYWDQVEDVTVYVIFGKEYSSGDSFLAEKL